jgi:chemotaxis protein methyltransferase CheR
MNGPLLEEHVKHLITARTGLLLRDEEQARLNKAVCARLRRLRLSDLKQYCELLRHNTSEWDELMPLLTTGETYFLRDQGQCGVIEHHLLPALIECNRHRRSLRLWSAGCSSGEEAYSLAVLIDKLLPDRDNWDIRIIGTDINPQALEQARRGRYDIWSFRMSGPDFRARYFQQRGNQWEVIDSIRSLVTFRPSNLVADPFPNPAVSLHEMDLILCRNVFIYFHRDAITHVLSKLAATLVPGGYLLTGHTELHGQDLGPLRLRLLPGAAVYEHTGGNAPAEDLAAAGRALENELSRQRNSSEHRWSIPARTAEALSKTERLMSPIAPTGKKVATVSGRSWAGVATQAVGVHPDDVAAAAPVETDKVNPGAIDHVALLAEAQGLLDRGDYLGAIATAMRAAAFSACSMQAALLAARAHANLGEHEPAMRCCRQVLDRDPLNADAYYLLAQLAEERGDREEVKRLLKKVLYVDASCVAAHLELGALYEGEGNPERANRMRVAALQLLKTPPADGSIPHFPGVTAAELRLTVEQLIVQDESRSHSSNQRW